MDQDPRTDRRVSDDQWMAIATADEALRKAESSLLALDPFDLSHLDQRHQLVALKQLIQSAAHIARSLSW